MNEEPRRYLRARQVRKRYDNISDMTLYRWLHDEELGFPRPRYFGRDRFWDAAELDAFDRRKLLEAIA